MELKFPMSEEEVQRYLAESAAALARKPVKSRHALVTLGSKTERGNEVVTASAGLLQPVYTPPSRSEIRS